MTLTTEGVLLFIGAIFFLIGLLGGGFDTIVIKVPPVGKYPRIISTTLGMVLITTACFRLFLPVTTTTAPTTPPLSSTLPPATTSSQSVEVIVQNLRQQGRMVIPPRSGKLKHSKNQVDVEYLWIKLRDLALEARFYNPYDANLYKWSYGFSFRLVSEQTQSEFEVYDLFLRSEGKSWSFRRKQGEKEIQVAAGSLPSLDTSINGSNQLNVYVKGKKAYFFVNNKYIETLDASELISPGLATIGANFEAEGIDEKSTRYEDLAVWNLESDI